MKFTSLQWAPVMALCFLLAVSCQKDDDNVINTESGPQHDYGISEKIINNEDLKAIPEAFKIIRQIEKLRSKDGSSQKSVYNDDYDFYVNTDSILRIDNGSFHSLTLSVFRLPDTGFVENLVLSSQSNGSYTAALYKYNLTAQEKTDIAHGNQSLISNPVVRELLPQFNPSTVAGMLITIWYTETIVIPCSSGEHGAHNFGLWHKCTVTPPKVVTVTRSITMDDGNTMGWIGGGEYNSGSPGASVGGGGGGGYVPAFDPFNDMALVRGQLTRPIIPQPSKEYTFYYQLDATQQGNMQYQSIRKPVLASLEANHYSEAGVAVAKFVLTNAYTNIDQNLSIAIVNLAKTNPEAALAICNFLDENDFDEESDTIIRKLLDVLSKEEYDNELVNDVVTAIVENPVVTYTSASYPGKADGMPFEWWKNETYMNNNMGTQPDDLNAAVEGPNKLELFLFSQFPIPAAAHAKNTKEALNRTLELTAGASPVYTDPHNGKADAFRHTYWNALDVSDIGNFFTKLFTDAHEWQSDNDPLETAMDYHNNGVGRLIGADYWPWTSANDIEEIVHIFIGNGDCKYLSPLDDGEIIPNVTTIKFTNQ